MKNINTLISIILLIAVIFLFVKVYPRSSSENRSNSKIEESRDAEGFNGAKIAFVNSDTLVAKYDYQQELSKDFEKKAEKVESELAVRSKAFEENYRVFVEQSKSLSPERLQSAQAELQQMEQQILQYQRFAACFACLASM